MGAKGIRPRKRRRRLPKVKASVREHEMVPPNIMWPEKGSGFEANQYSPAGTSQREWWLIRAAGSGNRKARVLVLAFLVVPIAIALLSQLGQVIFDLFLD